jgi:hypothetical protein
MGVAKDVKNSASAASQDASEGARKVKEDIKEGAQRVKEDIKDTQSLDSKQADRVRSLFLFPHLSLFCFYFLIASPSFSPLFT